MAEFDDTIESEWESSDTFESSINPMELIGPPARNAERSVGYEAAGIAIEAGTDPVQAMSNAGIQGVQKVHEDYQKQAQQTIKAGYDAYINTAARSGTLQTQEQVNQIVKLRDEEMFSVSDQEVLAPYRAKVLSTPSGASMDPFAVDRAAVNYYIDHTIQTIKDEAGLGDWGNAIFTPDYTYNINEIGKAYLGTSNMQGLTSTAEIVDEFARRFHAMPAQAQVEVVGSLVKFVEELDGSKIDQTDMLAIFLDRTPADSFGGAQAQSTLDKAGIATMPFIQATRFVMGSMNAVKKMVTGGNTNAAGKFIHGALKDPKIADDLDMSTQQAADYINPMFGDDLPANLKGAPKGTAERLTLELDKIDAHIAEANNIVDEGIGLTPAQRQTIAMKEAETIRRMPGVDKVEIGEETQTGFRVNITRSDTGDESYYRDFVLDDITGEIAEKDLGFVASIPGAKYLLSPNVMLGKDAQTLGAGLERNFVHTPAKVKAGLVGAMDQAQKGLGKKSIDKLNHVLEKGADARVVYTYDDLVNTGINGVRLTPKEYESYVATRRVIDHMWAAEDKAFRKELRIQGIKDVNVGQRTVHAKPYKDSKAASQAYAVDDLNKVFVREADGSTKVLDSVDKKLLDEYYGKDYTLSKAVKTEDNLLDVADTKVGWMLTPKSNVTRLEGPVLGYNVGHAPRIYDSNLARIFVKEIKETNIDGVATQTGFRTLAYTDNIAEAEAFVKHQAEIAEAAGGKSNLVIKYDREMSEADLNNDILQTWGGSYRGAKREEALPFLKNGGKVQANTVAPIESLQRYINHIASKSSISAYRLGAQRKWLQQAKDAGAIRPDFKGGFYQGKAAVEVSAVPAGVKGKLLASHNVTEFVMRVPTLGEQQFTGALRKVSEGLQRLGSKYGDGLVGKGLNISAKGVQKIDDSSLTNVLRAATFHVNLGLFNLAQILTQASGMTIAASINPAAFAKGLVHIKAFSQLDNIKDPIIKAQALERMRKAPGQEGLSEAYEAWNKSGLYQSIVTSNADAYALSTAGPISRGLMAKSLDAGLTPYRIGETINTRTAFLTAYNVWKSANKGKVLDDDAMKSILQRTDAYRLHMNQVDKAEWQKGLLALPTQFMSVMAKYMQAVLPGFSKDFTALERTRLIFGQAALFGSAGVPLGTYALEWALEQTGLLEAYKNGELPISPEMMRGLQSGTIGWLMNDYFDIDAVITSRVAIGQGVTDLWTSFISDPNDAPAMFFLGASGSMIDRSMKSWQTMLNAGKVASMNWDTMSSEQQLMLLDTFGRAMLDIPSSSKKALWALNFRDNPVFTNSDGTRVLQTSPPNFRSHLFHLAGFSSQQQEDFYKMADGRRAISDAKSAASKVIMKTFTDMMKQTDGDVGLQDWAWEQTLGLALHGFSAAERRDVMKLVVDKMKSNSTWGQEYMKFMKEQAATFGANANLLNPTLIKLQEQYTAEKNN